jgi:hypothetical protein
MRKFIGLVAVIAFLWVAAVPAQALTLPNATQTVSAKLYDQTSFFDSGTPRKPANVGDDLVAVGDEVRAVFDVTQFDGLTTGAIYSNVTLPAGGPADLTEELAGLLYDMEVKTILLGGVSVTDLTLGVDSGEFEILLKAGGRLTGSPTSGVTNSGGRLDLWDDPTLNNLDVRTGFNLSDPSSWGESAAPAAADAHDDFPFVTDDTNAYRWLAGQFVPLKDVLAYLGVITDAEIIFRITGSLTLGGLFSDDTRGAGFMDVTVNKTGVVIADDTYGLPGSGADVQISTGLNRGTAKNNWEAGSDDPVLFVTEKVPEPASMSLLLVGLVGSAGAYWRRRRAA